MLLRLSTAASRAVIVLLSLVAAISLSYFSIRNALAAHAVGLNSLEGYQRAVRLEPGNTRNWYLLGRYWQYNMENPDPQRAITYYRRALSFDPHSADTWLDLATAYDGEGEIDQSRQAFLSAKRIYPASADVAWRYGNFLLRQGETPLGFTEIHRAVIADPNRGAEAFSRCWRVEPDAEAILEKVIPPSKNIYLAIIHDLAAAAQLDPALVVWKHLLGIRPKMSPQEIGTLTNALLREGRIADLQSVWTQAVSLMDQSPPPDPAGSVIWDGGFESGIVGDGLAWQFLRESHGVHADLDSQEEHSGKRSLRLAFSGRENVNYSDACHFAIVAPGASYRFSAWVQTKNLTTSEGVRFRLRSFSKTGSTVVETSSVHGAEPWTNVTLPWTSPPASNLVQVCVTRNPSDDIEGNIRGSAWIDDVSLVPVPSSISKP
jgi:tetratricopeptide (TPR) repeat protein